jgi:hypothetical protein
MIWALLIALGVELIVIVAFATLVLGRRRWLKKQPGTFAGAIRVSSGDIDGLKPKWKRGSGRWVRDVLVWSKAPLLIVNELIPVDGLLGERETKAGEVKRLGDHPVAVEFATDGAKIEVAAKADSHALVTGPLTVDSAPAPPTTALAGSEDRHPQAAVGGL